MPRAIVFHVTWGGKVLRCLIDSGCTFECVVSDDISLDPNKLVSAQKTRVTVNGLGGTVDKELLFWNNQGLSVQGTRVNVRSMTQIDMTHLKDYDMILGLPFLQRYMPDVCWRTGKLKFDKFTWHQPPDLLQTSGMQTVSAAEIERHLENPKRFVGTKDEIEDLVFVRMTDVVAAIDCDADASGLGLAKPHEAPDLKPDRDNTFDVPDVPPEKQHKVLNSSLSAEQKMEMLELLQRFRSSMSDKGNLPHADVGFKNQPDDWAFRIPSKEGVEPPHHKPRPMTPAEKAECKRQLQWFVSHGFLKPSSSTWSSAILFVRKKNGEMRMCCDYRAANLASHHSAQPLPNILALFDKLVHAKYVSALDMIAGYQQIKVHPDDQHKTAIVTPFGQFEFTVCPFGLSGVPGHFQQIMTSLFGDFAKPDKCQARAQRAHGLSEGEEITDSKLKGAPFSSFVANLLDDLLIFSETWESHLEHVSRVLARLEKHNLYCNMSKCTFGFFETNYLGNIVGNGKRRPDPDKVQALKDFPMPETVTELRSWLGIANYLSAYIKDYAKIAAPFSELRGQPKGRHIVLNKEQVLAFNKLKQAMASGAVLQLPDFNKKFYLQCDASKYAVGSALLQEYGGTLLPVAYRSISLSGPEQRWHITDKELYAVVDATRHFRTYLRDELFVIQSDHKPLEHIRTQPKVSDRMLRWLDHLAMYHFEWEYVPGEEMVYADLLSRPPLSKLPIVSKPLTFEHSSCDLCRRAALDSNQDRFEIGPALPPSKRVKHHTCKEHAVVAALESQAESCTVPQHGHDQTTKPRSSGQSQASKASESTRELGWSDQIASLIANITGVEAVPMQRIKDAYASDADCKKIIEVLNQPGDQHHFNRKYKLVDGLLLLTPSAPMKHWRVIVPKGGGDSDVSPPLLELRQSVMKLYHDSMFEGHRNAQATYARVRERFFWPNMEAHCVRYVHTCDECQRHKYQPKKPKGLLQPLPVPSTIPFEELTTDFATCLPWSKDAYTGTSYDAIQVYVCRLSRRVRLIPCRSTDTAKQTVRNFMTHMFKHHGLPRSIVSDRDPKFTANFYKFASEILGIKLNMTSSHNPRADGLSERVVGVVTTLVRIYCGWHQNDWVDMLGQLEFGLNKHVTHSRGGQPPFLITDGYVPYAPSDFVIPKALENTEAHDFAKRQQHAATLAQDAILRNQDIMAKQYNGSRSPHTYKVGDKVLLKSAHVFPPGDRERPSKKLRSKYVGPYTITRLVGPNALEIKLTGGLKNHPVFSVDSTKPFHPETRIRVAKSAGVEDGDVQWTPLEILKYMRRQKRHMWLVKWEGVDAINPTDPDTTWEPLESFITSKGTTQILVEFEEDRVRLQGTLDQFAYSKQTPGTTATEADGFTVYHARENEVVKTIASRLKLSLQNFVMQNEMRYANFTAKSKLKAGTQLRLPRLT